MFDLRTSPNDPMDEAMPWLCHAVVMQNVVLASYNKERGALAEYYNCSVDPDPVPRPGPGLATWRLICLLLLLVQL